MAQRLAIIASKGTLDMAYPPLILASTAVAMDMECGVFFTFYGLDIINKKKYANLKVAPIANPAMPVPVPNLIGMLPGMTAMATNMMKGMLKKANMPTIPELIKVCHEGGVKLWPCQMTLDVMGIKPEDIVPEAEPSCGAGHFLDYAADADISLFI
jgi:peroxiredoxin family protein